MANFAKVRGMRKLHGRQWRKQLPPGTLPLASVAENRCERDLYEYSAG
jgi:hypothetical protein